MRVEENFVANVFTASANTAMLAVYNPATDELIAQVPSATAAEAIEAVEIAARAQRSWRQLTSTERGLACINWRMLCWRTKGRLAKRWHWSPVKAWKMPPMKRCMPQTLPVITRNGHGELKGDHPQ